MFTFHSWSGVRCHVECMKLERTVEAARVMSRLTWHHPQSTRVLRHSRVPCTHVPRVDTLYIILCDNQGIQCLVRGDQLIDLPVFGS